MKLLKPSWVHHDEKPIFSIDVHQECLKFATGGQGADSGRVVIWNLMPVLSEKAELDEAVPKMLCQMDNHLACVNCVRWSQSGLMLASCSDDKLVMIWMQSKGPSGVFGTGGIQKNPESWKCAFTLRGHSGDVLDLAWSPQDRWLSSCSIDNTIIVWDGQNFPAMVAMLKGHTGLVKGVAWDPVGKYLASQSDDRSVKIWKTSDWTCSSTITEPFEECGGTTHILRLSWSPDGQYLVSAHAMNGGGPTAQIIEREGWKCDKDFVGHRKAVTCVRFHTAILKRQAPKAQKTQQYCCLAVGSRDRSLSVWMTALQRPLVVIHELFNDSILDLSWGPDKCILMACSGDGTVACLQFSENELGNPLSEEDKNALYQRIYGKTAVVLTNGSTAATDYLIENPELFTCTQDKIKPPTLPIVQVINYNNNNIESASAPAPFNGLSQNRTIFSQNSNATESGSNTPMKAINKQMETRTKDGKRRITPVFIPLNQDVIPSTTATISSTMNCFSQANQEVLPENKQSQREAVVASIPSNKDLTTSSTVNITKTTTGDHEKGRLDPRLVKSATAKPRAEPYTIQNDIFESFPHFKQTPKCFTDINSTSYSGSGASSAKAYQASTAGPKITITATSKCEFQKTALDYRIHVYNGFVQTANGLLAKVTVYRLATGKLWETFVGSPIVNFNFCVKSVMLCSLDGTMRLLDLLTGSPLMPVITLTTAAIQCAFSPKGHMVGIITDCGLLRIWNISACTAVLATTCTEIFGKHGTVIQFTITEHGVPLVLFSNGQAFSYSQQLQSWLVLNTKDPIMRYGLRSSICKEFHKNYLSYPLTSIQAATTTFVTQSSGIDLNADDWQSVAKLTFIENQIKLCEAINSPEELKHWYTMLAFHLAIGNDEHKIRLLLNDLLGTNLKTPSTERKQHILNIHKHDLLDLVLDQFKVHIKWQRIYMEYNELFQDLKKRQQQQQRQLQEQTQMDNTNEKLTAQNEINVTKESTSTSKTNVDESRTASSSSNSAKLDSRMDIT